MKFYLVYFALLCLLLGCQTKQKATSDSNAGTNLQISRAFIDAFYSFDQDSLKAALSSAPKSHPSILYYQKWAECGHYEVLERFPCSSKNDTLITCPVMVKDDLMSALQLDLNVTDTFHITVKEGLIRSVTTSSNDPEVYYEGKAWIEENRPELIKEPCKDAWNGGPTPCECIKGTVQGLKEFAELNTKIVLSPTTTFKNLQVDTSELFGIWTSDPDGPHADFWLTDESYFMVDYDGNGDIPYALEGRTLTVFFEEWEWVLKILSTSDDTLRVYSQEYGQEYLYTRWRN